MKVTAKYHILDGIQWKGDNGEEVWKFMEDVLFSDSLSVDSDAKTLLLRDEPYAELNDWILRDQSGLKFVVKPEIFGKSYSVVEEVKSEKSGS